MLRDRYHSNVSVVLLSISWLCSSVVAQNELAPFPTANFGSVAAVLQSDEQELDWKQEYKRLEIRLRELENDFVSQRDDYFSDKGGFDSFSDETSEELKSLQQAVSGLTESVDGLEKNITKTVSHVGAGRHMQIFGRIHLAYFAFSDIDASVAPLFGGNPQDLFGIRRLRIGVKGDVNDNTFYKIQTEFFDANDFQFRDVFMGIRNLPFLQTVIVGNHKRPYNLDQLNSSNDNVFLDRPYIGEAFNDSNRRFGISSSGYSENLRYNWRSGVFNMRDIQNDGIFSGDNYQLELASRLAATPWYDDCSGGRGYMHLAISGANRFPDGLGPNNQSEYSTIPEAFFGNILTTGPIFGAESESLYGLEAVLNVGAFQVGAEYTETFIDRFEPVGPNINFHGGYLYAAYMLTGEHMPWNRKFGTLGRVTPFENFFAVRDGDGIISRGLGAWQLAARYSYIDLNDEDILAGSAESLTLGLNWYWNRHARMQFNYINADAGNAGRRREL